jgi:hypothetical protein
VLNRGGALHQAMPALLLLGLLTATQPALARGLVPVCTKEGTHWVAADGEAPARTDQPGACAHGWCTPRKSRPTRG